MNVIQFFNASENRSIIQDYKKRALFLFFPCL